MNQFCNFFIEWNVFNTQYYYLIFVFWKKLFYFAVFLSFDELLAYDFLINYLKGTNKNYLVEKFFSSLAQTLGKLFFINYS